MSQIGKYNHSEAADRLIDEWFTRALLSESIYRDTQQRVLKTMTPETYRKLKEKEHENTNN